MATTPENLVHKSVPISGFNIVEGEGEGIVEAFVSGIGNKDSVDDIIQPGAFDQFLKIRKPKGVWSHDWEKPISKTLEIYEVPAGDKRLPLQMQLAGIGGLYVKTQFNLNTQLGKDAYETVKFFADEGQWSIGYVVHDAEYDKKLKAMKLKQIELFEYSPVLFGANSLTSTVSVKALKDASGNVKYQIEGLGDMETKAVQAAMDVVLKQESIPSGDDDDTEEKAEMASDTDSQAAFSVVAVGDTFAVVDTATSMIREAFTDEEKAQAYADELNSADEATEDVEEKADETTEEVTEEAEATEVDEVDEASVKALGDEDRSHLEKALLIVQGWLDSASSDETEEKVDEVVETEDVDTSEKVEVKYIQGSIEESARIIANLVKGEVSDTLKELAEVEEGSWCYIYALGTFSDNVVFEVSSDSGCKYYRVEYTINGSDVEIGDITEVEVDTVVTTTVSEIDEKSIEAEVEEKSIEADVEAETEVEEKTEAEVEVEVETETEVEEKTEDEAEAEVETEAEAEVEEKVETETEVEVEVESETEEKTEDEAEAEEKAETEVQIEIDDAKFLQELAEFEALLD